MALALALSATARAEQHTAVSTDNPPRFQLFAASVSRSGSQTQKEDMLFRIDTTTGQVWMYLSMPEGNGWVMGWTKVQELPSHRNPTLPDVPPPLKQ